MINLIKSEGVKLRYLILLKVCVFSFLMACQTNQPIPLWKQYYW